MTPKRHARHDTHTIDEARSVIAIYLERAVGDIRAAAIEVEKLPDHRGQQRVIAVLATVSKHLAVVHNRYSRIKQS